jgi:2-oxoglutarate ferredoxin oxidoreductase subunit alpha
MLSLMKMECNAEQFAKLRSIRHYVGLPIDGRSVTTELLKQEGR